MTTYRIDYVPDVPMTDINGDPVHKIDAVTARGVPVYAVDEASNRVRQVAEQLKFMLGNITGPKFVEKLESMDAAMLVFETRQALREQASEAKARGYWELDGDAAKRLRIATEEPRTKEQIEQKLVAYDLGHVHNFVPFMVATSKMKKVERTAIEKQLPEPEVDKAAE
jgi:hypothetical protein